MPKSLIITEKPSVARDIVQALGGFQSMAGGAYWESDAYVCSFAVGHILSLLSPEDLDPAYRSWKLSLLPIIPKAFGLKPIEGHEKRIKLLSELIHRQDVNCLINACDAAREGELIFREIVQFADSKKWVRRLWLQSMTTEAIRAGFNGLRDGTDLEGLGQAAECRARADWLIGMNATRAFSERLRSQGERKPWSVGRVQTPTLALLVERELKILGHVPEPFFKVVATFEHPTHTYEGTWFDPTFKADEAHPEKKDDRIFGRAAAEDVVTSVDGDTGLASETREESPRHAPYLFNLTALQKYMSTRYKFTAKRTLEAAQRCYEQHKVLTYPRTNASCLPGDYRPEVRRLVEALADDAVYGESARYLLANGLRNEKRVFDDKGVDDHFAIIPTGKFRSLGGDDAKVFDAVVRRFLATFFPPAIYDKVKRTTVAAGHHFRTGPVETLIEPGWLVVYDKQGESNAEAKLPALVAGAKAAKDLKVAVLGAELKEEETRPPPRINEAGLLGLMEHAGRHVENEELAKALMSAEGLGTAATRADIIQNLKIKEYVDEALRPTFKGIHLITTLKKIHAERLTSAELTARLELELSEVEDGKRQSAMFMSEISRYATEVVDVAKAFDLDKLYAADPPLGLCPACGLRQVVERSLDYRCDPGPHVAGIPKAGCGFALPKDLGMRALDRRSAATLVQKGETGDLEGFRTRDGKEVRASLKLRDGKVVVVDSTGRESRVERRSESSSASRQGASAAPAAGERVVVGACPIHKGECQVIETRNAYACEKRLEEFRKGVERPTGVLISKLVASRQLSASELAALLETGRTGELSGFKSKLGKPFSAALVMRGDGGVGFEFQPSTGGDAGRKFPTRGKRNPKRASGGGKSRGRGPRETQ